MTRLLNLSLRAVLIMILMSQTAMADRDHNEALRMREAGDILPLETILEKLRPRYKGKILEVELERESGQIVYEVEILAEDGVVHELYIDARTGQILRSKVDD